MLNRFYGPGRTSGAVSNAFSFPYLNEFPVQVADQDTLLDPATYSSGAALLFTCLFSIDATGVQYAITVYIENGLAVLQPDARTLRSAEPVSGSGDVAFAVWLDGTSGTYHYSLDVDGGGKTLDQISVTVKTQTAG